MTNDPDRLRRAEAVTQALHDSEKREILEDDREVEDQAQRFEAAVQRTRPGGMTT
jgi:hypothetical protein